MRARSLSRNFDLGQSRNFYKQPFIAVACSLKYGKGQDQQKFRSHPHSDSRLARPGKTEEALRIVNEKFKGARALTSTESSFDY
jgi:hypothetical protein